MRFAPAGTSAEAAGAMRSDLAARNHDSLVFGRRSAGPIDYAHVLQGQGGRVGGHERPHPRREAVALPEGGGRAQEKTQHRFHRD